jgi:hypothetical protein
MKPNLNDKVYRLINFHAQLEEQSSVRPVWRANAQIFIPRTSHKRTNKK